MDNLKTWGLNCLCSVCSSFSDIQVRPRRAFQLSTFHRLSSLILRNPAPFTTPSEIMVRMLPVHAWCPRYRPTYSFVYIPHATALDTAGLQQTDSPHSATSFFHARPERCISAVKPSLPILKKLITSDAIIGIHLKMQWDSTTFPACASSAHSSVRFWHARHLGVHAKPIQQLELPTTSQSRELRSMALHHFAVSLGDIQAKSTQLRHKP